MTESFNADECLDHSSVMFDSATAPTFLKRKCSLEVDFQAFASVDNECRRYSSHKNINSEVCFTVDEYALLGLARQNSNSRSRSAIKMVLWRTRAQRSRYISKALHWQSNIRSLDRHVEQYQKLLVAESWTAFVHDVAISARIISLRFTK